MKRGDIHWVDLPDPNPAGPRVQAGRRPALIVQSEDARTFQHEGRTLHVHTLTVVPLTSKLKAQIYPCAFVIRHDEQNGLTQDSVVLLNHIQTVDRLHIQERIGTLSAAHLEELNERLRTFFAV